MPGRQVGDGGGAWEEFDCDEALSDPGEKAWEGFIHPLSQPSHPRRQSKDEYVDARVDEI